MECSRQGLAHQFTWIQGFATFRNVREKHFDKGILAIGHSASLVFRADNPLDRCEVQLAKRIVLIAGQTLSVLRCAR